MASRMSSVLLLLVGVLFSKAQSPSTFHYHTSFSLSFASLLPPRLLPHALIIYFIARWRVRSRSATRIHLHIRTPTVRQSRALCSVTSHRLQGLLPAIGRARASPESHSKNTTAAVALLVTQFLSFQTWTPCFQLETKQLTECIPINCYEFGTLEKNLCIISHVSLKS